MPMSNSQGVSADFKVQSKPRGRYENLLVLLLYSLLTVAMTYPAILFLRQGKPSLAGISSRYSQNLDGVRSKLR
jgi:hypothetical protein